MKLTIKNLETGKDHVLTVSDNEILENLKALLEIETQIPLFQQDISFNNSLLPSNFHQLSLFGIRDGSKLTLKKNPHAQPPLLPPAHPAPVSQPQPFPFFPQAQQQPASDANLLNSFFNALGGGAPAQPQMQQFGAPQAPFGGFPPQADPFAAAAEAQLRQEAINTRNYFLANESELQKILHQDPELAQAILGEDMLLLEEIIRVRTEKRKQQKLAEMQRLQRLAENPLDIEAQKQIEEMVHNENVKENLETAQEYYPEMFTHITMLYVECQVGGVELQAFVDSGAQMTIMSRKTAEKCNLMKLLDKRCAGMAHGVGTGRILGKIHAVDMRINNITFPISISVLEDTKIGFIFGLDNIKRHQCCIDCAQNKLVLRNGEVSVPFLAEKDIIRDVEEEAKLEEAIQQYGKEDDIKKFGREKIDQLIKMGFKEDACIKALKMTNGDPEAAGALLFETNGEL